MTRGSWPVRFWPFRGPLPLVLVALTCGVAVLLPIVYLVVRAVDADFTELQELLWRQRNLVLLRNTLLLTLLVVVAVTLISAPAAWLVTRCRLWGGTLWTVMLVLPLAIPGYLMAFTLLAAGGSYGWLVRWLGIPMPALSGLTGATIALSLYLFPYMFLNMQATLLRMDASLEEAAKSLGAGTGRVLARVVLPQLLHGYMAAALLVSLHVIGDFGVVSLMRFETFSYALYQQYTGSFDRTYAAWIALMLMAVSASFIVGEFLVLRDLGLERAGPGAVRRPRRIRLGWWNIPACLALALVVLAAVGVPLATILFWLGQAGDQPLWRGVWPAALSSLQVSAPAAIVATALALPIAILAVRYPGFSSRLLERVAWLGYAVPPLAFGLGLVFFSLRLAPVLYHTMWLLVIAFSLRFLAEALGPVRSALVKTERRMEEAAKSLGANPMRTFLRVTFPVVRPGILVALVFVCLSCLKELPLTVLLAPAGFKTLAYSVWDFTSEGLYAQAAPYALALLLCCVALMSTLWLRPAEFE